MNDLVATTVFSELAKPQPAGEVTQWFIKRERIFTSAAFRSEKSVKTRSCCPQSNAK